MQPQYSSKNPPHALMLALQYSADACSRSLQERSASMFRLKVGVLSDSWELCVLRRDLRGLEDVVLRGQIPQQYLFDWTPRFESDVLAAASLAASLMFLLKGSADKGCNVQGRALRLAVLEAQELLLQ